MNSFKTNLILFFAFSSFGLIAQTTITPERITTKDGLSQGFIYSMHQDKEGFLWFGTKNGLNRYDGEKFEVFTNDPTKPYSISDDRVKTIIEYGDYLLLGAVVGGMNIFHKPTKRFYKIPITNPQINFWTSLDIIGGSMDRLGQCWVYGAGLGRLVKLTFPEKFWQGLPEDESLLQQIEMVHFPDINMWQIPKIDSNYLFVIDADVKHLKINISTSEIEYLQNQLPVEQKFLGYGEHSQGELISFGTYEIQKIFVVHNDTWLTIPTDFPINAIFYLKEAQQLWINSEQDLLLFENWEAEQKKLYRRDADFVISSTNSNEVYKSLLKDRSGNFWVASNGYGLIKINPRLLKIKKYFNDHSVYGTPFMKKDQEIVVTSLVGPILSTHSNLSMPIELNPNGGTWWLTDNFENVWAVSRTNNDIDNIKKIELVQIDENNNIRQKEILGDLDYISYHTATIQKEKGLIWVAVGERKLFRYEIASQELKTYSFEHLFHNPLNCFSITSTPNGHWWIGTAMGLVHGIPNGDDFDFELIQGQQGNTNGLLNIAVSSVLPDINNDNILWVATKGGGLHRLDINTMTFSYLNSKSSLAPHQSKLPNDVIYGILNDDSGNLWMSSNRGIIRYHIDSGKLSNFTEADGLQNDEFNTWAYAKAHTGELMFGGIDGLNVFYPDDLKDQTVQAKVFITSLAVNNQSVSVGDSTGILTNALEFTKEIDLPFSRNSISVEFAALEYSAPFKNRYRYYLEGAEEEWAHEDTDNKANYLNLAPGTYTFKVMGSNGDGIWNEQATKLKINILPPWYRSNLAYLMYALLAGLLFWRMRHYEKKRLELRHSMELEQQKAERLKEMDEVKSKLYTNITHEFRTPLTVISGIAEQLNEEDKKTLITRNSNQLLNLVNQMLDLRKLKSGAVVFQNEQADMVKFLRYLTESLKSYAQLKELNTHFLADEEKLIMDFDADKITRIHSNLLSNAIKFTPKGGDIYVQLSVDEKGSDRNLVLKIRDSGIGIPAEKLPFIFERFYEVDDSTTRKGEGTGIGLTLVYELVKAMKGDIQVISKERKGTTFTLQLPITNIAEMASEQELMKGMNTGMMETTNLDALSPASSTKEVEGQKPMALIVEDNADVIHYLIACLGGAYKIVIAMNGKEGIDKALEEIPDLIISDVMMPIKDGYELCHTLKMDERTSHIPIVLLTAKADFESRLEGLQRGADAYLSKPFHQDELRVILGNQLALRKKLQLRYLNLSNAPPSTVHPTPATDIENAFLQKIRALIEKDLSDDDIGMPQLMRHLAMGRSQIYRKVKALTGRSPSVYIRSIRLHHAQRLLKQGELNVSDVAYEVGFSSPVYFSDIYLKEFGVRPSGTPK